MPEKVELNQPITQEKAKELLRDLWKNSEEKHSFLEVVIEDKMEIRDEFSEKQKIKFYTNDKGEVTHISANEYWLYDNKDNLTPENYALLQSLVSGTSLDFKVIDGKISEIRKQFENTTANITVDDPILQTLIDKIIQMDQPETYPSDKPNFYNETMGILQREVGYTDSKSNHPILASFGAGPCIIVVAYNPETKKAGLCHIDALTDKNTFDFGLDSSNGPSILMNDNLKSLENMLDEVRGTSQVKLEIHLAGNASSQDNENFVRVTRVLSNSDFVEIKTADIGKSDDSEALAIDTRDGKIYTDFEPTLVKSVNNLDKITMGLMMSSPLNSSFGGQGLEGKEADLLADIKMKYGSLDKEYFDVVEILSREDYSIETKKAELRKELGDLKPKLGEAFITGLQEKYLGKE